MKEQGHEVLWLVVETLIHLLYCGGAIEQASLFFLLTFNVFAIILLVYNNTRSFKTNFENNEQYERWDKMQSKFTKGRS